MEFKKRYYNAVKSYLDQCPNSSQNHMNANYCLSIYQVNYVEYKQRYFAANTKSKSDDNVKKEKHEKFSIGKSYAV